MTHMPYAARNLLSFICFNLGWWACAIGASRGWPWFGPALLPLWMGLHLYYAPVRKGEALFLVLIGTLGFVIDTAFLHLGLFTLASKSLFAPAWLVTMWILLGQNFESMLMMRRNRWLLALSGAISGPLSYYCGEAVNVLHYARPLWMTLSAHAVFWALLMPMLFKLRDYSLSWAIGGVPAHPAGEPSQQARPALHLVKPFVPGKSGSAPPER